MTLLDAVRAAYGSSTWDGRCSIGMPQSPNHPPVHWHALPRRHGDMVRAGRRIGGQRPDRDGHPRRHPHRRARPRLPRRQAARRRRRRRGRPRRRFIRTTGCTRSRRSSAAACCWTFPRALGLGRLRAGYEITPADLDAAVRGRAPTVGAGDIVLIRTGWGRRFDDGSDAYVGKATGVPGVGEAGARWLAEPRRARRRRGHHRLRTARARGRARAAAGPPGAARRARHLHHRGAGTWRSSPRAGVHEFTFVLVAAATRRRHRSPVRPLAVVGRWLSSTLGAATRRVRGRAAATTGSPPRSATACAQRVLDVPRHLRRRDRPATPAAAALSCVAAQGGSAAGARRSAWPTAVPAAQAAFVNGVLAHSLDYDDTHLPSVLHPSAVGDAGRAGGGASAPAPTARRLVAAIAVGLRGLRAARHGRLRPARPATRCSSSTASTPPRSAARSARAVAAGAADGAGRGPASPTRSASPPRWPSGIIEANRTGGTVKRMHCGWAAHAGGHRRPAGPARLHRPADGARGPVRLLRGLAARRRSTRTRSPRAGHGLVGARHLLQAIPGEPLHPRRDRRGAGAAGAGPAPGGRRSDRRSGSPLDGDARSASRSRSSVPRRPATWRSSAARSSSPPRCSAAAGSGVGLDDFTDAAATKPSTGR